METIKLKEIFEAKAFYNNCLYDLDVNQKNCILDMMQEVCNQSIELSEQNAANNYVCFDLGEPYASNASEIILKTKNQVENVPFLK